MVITRRETPVIDPSVIDRMQATLQAWEPAGDPRVAFVLPAAGRAHLESVKAAAKVPVWCFHGEKDEVESVETSRLILATLQAAGGKPLYTEYPGVKHNSFLWVYTEPALVDWLFAQHR